DVCFANPGTTELELVRALEQMPEWRCVLGLQENVCTGAADGYGRMTGRPAVTLLHLGPGFANGIANLHNARRARTPVINLIGDHASWHLPFDAPLSSDIESLARPVSGWVHRVGSAQEAEVAATRAHGQSLAQGGQGATLIFPADFQAGAVLPAPVESSGLDLADRADTEVPQQPARATRARARLQLAQRPLFLLGGGGERSALSARGQCAVARLAAHLGGSAYAETFPSRAERGLGLPDFNRLPYFPEAARAVLDPSDLVVLVGALPPVTYFGYPGQPSRMVEEDRLLTLCQPGEDAVGELEALADALGAPVWSPSLLDRHTSTSSGAAAEGGSSRGDLLNPALVGATLAAWLPDRAIVSVEGGTCGYPFYAASAAARRHTALTNTGGAIGQGLPVALGASMACPDRPVVALLSDGSTQYTIQTLWSLAHERLPVTVLIAANHQYAILRNELRRGGAPLSDAAAAMTSLADPCIDWVGLAQAYGVPGLRARTVGELEEGLRRAFAHAPDSASGAAHPHAGPLLIEMAL
ncbi:MAG: acetolactate synthase large subunit, partial [Rubrivivax sp.]